MPTVTVSENLDNVESGFAPLPEGEYLVTCGMPEVAKSKAGANMLKLEATVVEPAEVEGVATAGRKVFLNLMLEGKGLGITKGFLEAAGVKWAGDSFNTEDIAGAMLRLRNKHQMYEGKVSNNVGGYTPQ